MEKSNTSGEKSKSPENEHDDFNSSSENNFLQKPQLAVKNGRDEKFEIESDASPHRDKEENNTDYAKCEIAKPELVKFYPECKPAKGVKFVNIEGPEFCQDYTYFLVHMCKEMAELE